MTDERTPAGKPLASGGLLVTGIACFLLQWVGGILQSMGVPLQWVGGILKRMGVMLQWVGVLSQWMGRAGERTEQIPVVLENRKTV